MGEAQQVAVASAHEPEAASDEANGSVAQVMSLPGSFGNAFGSEQTLGDRAIGGPLYSGVERAERQRQPLSALLRKLLERRSGYAATKSAPQSAGGMRAKIEDGVERQFDGVGFAGDRSLFQKKPVVDSAKAQEDMPAVRCSSQLACRQLT